MKMKYWNRRRQSEHLASSDALVAMLTQRPCLISHHIDDSANVKHDLCFFLIGAPHLVNAAINSPDPILDEQRNKIENLLALRCFSLYFQFAYKAENFEVMYEWQSSSVFVHVI